MGILTTAADTVYTFRFIKILSTSWENMPAFAQGVIDSRGAPLLKIRDMTSAQKETYTMFHRLVFKLKRLLEKLPAGKNKLSSYAAALWLIKEETGITDEALSNILSPYIDIDSAHIEESFIVDSSNDLLPGVYKLNNSIMCPTTGEDIAKKNDRIIVHGNNEEMIGNVFEHNIYAVQHAATKQTIYVVAQDLVR